MILVLFSPTFVLDLIFVQNRAIDFSILWIRNARVYSSIDDLLMFASRECSSNLQFQMSMQSINNFNALPYFQFLFLRHQLCFDNTISSGSKLMLFLLDKLSTIFSVRESLHVPFCWRPRSSTDRAGSNVLCIGSGEACFIFQNAFKNE